MPAVLYAEYEPYQAEPEEPNEPPVDRAYHDEQQGEYCKASHGSSLLLCC